MIGGKLHRRAQKWQVLAQTYCPGTTNLADAASWGTVTCGHGRGFPKPCSDELFRTPSLIGQVSTMCADLPDFVRVPKRLPYRRGLADCRTPVCYTLRTPFRAGFVPSSVKKTKKGWAGCEQQQEYSRHLRFARALRPAGTQRANRPSTARGRACLARLSLTAIRCLGPLRAPGPTCFIVNKTPASADRLAVSYIRPFAGPFHNTANAAANHLVRGGALRFRSLKTKDTPCSPKS